MDRDAYMRRVSSLVAHATEGPGGSWRVNEGGEAMVVDLWERGVDPHEAANLVMGAMAAGADVATPDWELE
jgi:hypothetical protein